MGAVINEAVAVVRQLLGPLPLGISLALVAVLVTGVAARMIALIETLATTTATRSES